MFTCLVAILTGQRLAPSVHTYQIVDPLSWRMKLRPQDAKALALYHHPEASRTVKARS